MLVRLSTEEQKIEAEKYNAEQAAPVSLHQFLWHSVGPVKPPDTLPLPSPQEKPDPRGVSLRLSSPPPYKQAIRRARPVKLLPSSCLAQISSQHNVHDFNFYRLFPPERKPGQVSDSPMCMWIGGGASTAALAQQH